MRPRLTTTLLAFTLVLVAAHPAAAQEEQVAMTSPGQEPGPQSLEAPRSTDLMFEREVFDYPQFTRRNPFVALVAAEGGPRFEQIRLRGIIHSEEPGESVALLGIGTVTEQSGATQVAPGATGRSRRIRVGGTWGNVRILEIRRTEIVVQVEEFGLTEQRIMRMPTRGQGD